ncbi:uncharacterized protein [Scyliorhinus torazame]|uniref:uncharacterized protein n=1 Tax=Scyliorhinus torazame TaxID=75743 RepID=UPI003B5988A0
MQPSDTAVYYCSVWGDISGSGSQLNVTSRLADPVLIQYPNISKVPEGETVELQCAMYNADVNDTDVHWYHQRPGYERQWMMSWFVNGTISKSRDFQDRFQHSQDFSSNSYILTIVNVTLNDTAVYSCSVWSYIHGAGSQLNVTDANAPVLIQSLSLERVTEGQTARLQCTMRNAAVTHTDVHWNRERPGKDMERVLTHDIKNNTRRSLGFTERFHPSRDTSNKTFILTISNVQPSDTAVYYCSVWGDISGNGSQLSVTKLPEKQLPPLTGIITGTLAFALLLGILSITILCVKKWACFQSRLKPESLPRAPEGELNTVYASVCGKKPLKKMETFLFQSLNIDITPEEAELFYADIQFFRQNNSRPMSPIVEEATVYAAVKRA